MSEADVTGETRRILLEAVVIILLGVVLGLSFNHRLVLEALQGREAAPAGGLRSSSAGARWPVPVDLPSLRRLIRRGAVLIDARNRELYRRGHLPGARSFPLGQADRWLGRFRRTYGPDALLVVYCSGHGCPDAFNLAVLLLKKGFRDVRVFEGGFPAWRDAGLPVAKEKS